MFCVITKISNYFSLFAFLAHFISIFKYATLFYGIIIFSIIFKIYALNQMIGHYGAHHGLFY